MSGFFGEAGLDGLLAELHARSEAQDGATRDYYRKRAEEGRTDFSTMDAGDHAHYADKLVALEPDKAQFCYLLCRALGARRVVELGTSFGVSTLYLAAAVRDNGGGQVIATEYEAEKAKAARETFARAGLAAFIDLREGDLRETLKTIGHSLDFALFDVWGPAVLPALELIFPHLRAGAVICADNTGSDRSDTAYGGYFAFVRRHGLRTQTLPFGGYPGGFEMTVKVG